MRDTSDTARYTRATDTFEMEVEGHTVIVDRATEQMITVNEVAGVIWNQLSSASTLDQIVDSCRSRYPDVDAETLVADVTEFLNAAASTGLVRTDA